MSQEVRALLAGVLSLAVFLLWYQFYGKNLTPPSQKVVEQVAQTPKEEKKVSNDFSQPVSSKNSSFVEEIATITNDQVSWMMTNRGATLKGASFANYREGVDAVSPKIDMILSDADRALLLTCSKCNFSLPDESAYRLVSKSDRSIAFEATSGGVKVKKEFRFESDVPYLFATNVTVVNGSGNSLNGRLGLMWKGKQKEEKEAGFFKFLKGPPDQRSFVYQLAGKMDHFGTKDESVSHQGQISWAGIEDRYFLMALINRRLSTDGVVHMSRQPGSVTLALSPGNLSVPRGSSYQEKFTAYVGPKDRALLEEVGVGLEQAVDYGFFSILAIPILKLLKFFFSIIGNWGLAIILLTVGVKLLLNPLSVKSFKQMKEMQKIQPKLKEIKEKYKDDKQRLNAEMMQLFKTHKVNPMGGCLPMLLQMPIYIALYKVLFNSIELYHAPFFLFYKDLSAPDPYLIFPVLLGIVMVAQQKMTPSASADPMQKQMMMLMPIMFTGFMLFLPMGLVLYIFVNTLMSVIQQYMHHQDIRFRDLFARLKRA